MAGRVRPSRLRRRAAAPCCVQVAAERRGCCGPDRVEDREDLVLLDELPRQLHGARRVVAVVEEAVVDLPPVDAALRVDVVEVRLRARPDRAERCGLARERHGAAEHDRRRSDAGIGGGGARGRGEEQRERAGECDAPHRETGFARSGARPSRRRRSAAAPDRAGDRGRAGCPGSGRATTCRASASGSSRPEGRSPGSTGRSGSSSRPVVGRPPPATTISLPAGVRAERTATMRCPARARVGA